MSEKKSVYEIITERFIAQLKEGIIPWEKPWISIKGERCGAWSHNGGTSYSLINQMMLPKQGEYLTYKQIVSENGRLKDKARSYPICFWKSWEVEVQNPDNNRMEKKQVPVLRYYLVYHIDDVAGIEQKYQPDLSCLDGLTEPERNEKAEETIKEYLDRTGVVLEHEPQNQACYNFISDKILLPLREQFVNSAEYYSTLFHEAIHSTGHRDRLDRLYVTAHGRRGTDYSLEELVAEMGACAMMFNLGLETKDTIRNSNAYLESWLTALKNDDKMIVKASGRAQKAVRYLCGDDSVLPPKKITKKPQVEPVVIEEIDEIPF